MAGTPVPMVRNPVPSTGSEHVPTPVSGISCAYTGIGDSSLIYSRTETPQPLQQLPTVRTESTGIMQSQTPAPDIIPVPSIHTTLGAHVSEANKSKIINGSYLDLALLLDSNSDKQEKQVILVDGVLVTKEKPKQNISNIEKWTDAFLVYSSIYLSAHPDKFQGILKYMYVIRLGASRLRSLGWKKYDEQFRLKMGMDPSKSWENIDQELWLIYMTDVPSSFMSFQTSNTVSSTMSTVVNQSSVNKCYNFNYKGICDRVPCIFKHVCFRCSGNHPFYSCASQNVVNPTFRPRATPSRVPQFAYRQRVQGPVGFRPQRQFGPRYLGPRQFANQN